MSEARPERPSKPLPHVVYRPPYVVDQPTRSPNVRDVWADVTRFMERAATPYRGTASSLMLTMRRWSAESMRNEPMNWLGPWPAECSGGDFAEAIRIVRERLGKPARRATKGASNREGLIEQIVWHVQIERAEEVVELLERVSSCTGGAIAPVHASFFSQFRLRDLDTGKPLPRQGKRHHIQQSSLRLRLQRDSMASMVLALPFTEPDAHAAEYGVALQELLPIWLDPRCFDHVTLAPDGATSPRRRLAPEWVGVTVNGALRLDVSKSGIAPAGDLRSVAEIEAEDAARDDAPINANYLTIETALHEHSAAALMIRGRPSDFRHLVKLVAKRLCLPVHAVDTSRADETCLNIGDELRAVLVRLGTAPAVVLIDLSRFDDEATIALVRTQACTRTMAEVALPPAVRLVVMEMAAMSEEARAAVKRLWTVRSEGFASLAQLELLAREAWRANNRDMMIELVPWDRPSDVRAPLL